MARTLGSGKLYRDKGKNKDIRYARLAGKEWVLGPVDEWPESRVQRELAIHIAQIEAGTWSGPPKRGAKLRPASPVDVPNFQEVATRHLQWKRGAGFDDDTVSDVAWKLRHLLSVLRAERMDRIGEDELRAFVALKQDEREYLTELRERHRAGEELTTDDLGKLFVERGVTKRGRRKVGVQKGIAATSINNCLSLFGNLWDETARKYPDHMPRFNPAEARGLKIPKAAYRGTYVTPTQALYLIEAAKEQDERARDYDRHVGRAAMICLEIVTGLRVSELLALEVGQLSFDQKILRVGDSKTEAGEQRAVPISPYALGIVGDYLDRVGHKDGLLFRTRHGNVIDRSRFAGQVLARAVREANERIERENEDKSAAHRMSLLPNPVTPHSLRRSYVSYLVRLGIDEARIMARAGHTDVRTTMNLYARADEGTWDEEHLKLIMGDQG